MFVRQLVSFLFWLKSVKEHYEDIISPIPRREVEEYERIVREEVFPFLCCCDVGFQLLVCEAETN